MHVVQSKLIYALDLESNITSRLKQQLINTDIPAGHFIFGFYFQKSFLSKRS